MSFFLSVTLMLAWIESLSLCWLFGLLFGVEWFGWKILMITLMYFMRVFEFIVEL